VHHNQYKRPSTRQVTHRRTFTCLVIQSSPSGVNHRWSYNYLNSPEWATTTIIIIIISGFTLRSRRVIGQSPKSFILIDVRSSSNSVWLPVSDKRHARAQFGRCFNYAGLRIRRQGTWLLADFQIEGSARTYGRPLQVTWSPNLYLMHTVVCIVDCLRCVLRSLGCGGRLCVRIVGAIFEGTVPAMCIRLNNDSLACPVRITCSQFVGPIAPWL